MALLQNRRLIARFNQGDIHALQEIYGLYKKDMMTLARALLFDKTLAEDVLHEVFAKLIGSTGLAFDTDKVGGMVAPNIDISGLSRSLGPPGTGPGTRIGAPPTSALRWVRGSAESPRTGAT